MLLIAWDELERFKFREQRKVACMSQTPDITPIIDKIKKLLALSTSSNPHEAALAAAKAQEMLARYNLEVSQVQTSEPVSRYEQTALSTGPRVWRRQLLHIIAKYNFCQTIYDSQRKQVLLIGERHNSEAVQVLYEHLAQQLDHMALESYQNSSRELPAITWKDSFYAGAIHSLDLRLCAQQSTFATTSSECRSLVVMKREELHKAVRRLYPNLQNSHAKRVRACDGYYEGVQAGRNVALHKALES
jgi:hypothetical protein